ncbi:hypothetical protein D3C72_1663200 [compost metagenome]
MHRQCRIHDQQVGHRHQHGHRREILARLVRQVGIERGIDRDGADIAHHDGVAIGRLLGHVVSADIAAGACLVLHHHGLPEPFPQLLADDSRQHVGGSTGRVRDNPFDRLARPGIAGPGGRPGHDCSRAGQRGTENGALHVVSCGGAARMLAAHAFLVYIVHLVNVHYT